MFPWRACWAPSLVSGLFVVVVLGFFGSSWCLSVYTHFKKKCSNASLLAKAALSVSQWSVHHSYNRETASHTEFSEELTVSGGGKFPIIVLSPSIPSLKKNVFSTLLSSEGLRLTLYSPVYPSRQDSQSYTVKCLSNSVECCLSFLSVFGFVKLLASLT